MIGANSVALEDIAAIFFTTTPDLNAEFPAVAVRELGWPAWLPMLCGHEMCVPGALPNCLRILILVNTEKAAQETVHVYLGEAVRLRGEKK